MNRKSYLVILGYFIILIIIPITIYLFKDQIKANFFKPKPQIQPKLIRQTTTTEAASLIYTQSHPSLFYANLEYDPKNGVVTLLNVGKTNGDLPPALPNPPKDSATRFIYKVEVVSDKNELLETGWFSTPKELITTDKGTFKFTITTSYKPNYHIRVYLPPNKQIWTGVIK